MNILDLSSKDFNNFLAEQYSYGASRQDLDNLRRKYREKNSPFSYFYNLSNDFDNEISSQNRRQLLGGLFSKEIGREGLSSVRPEGILPFLSNIVSSGAKAIDAPFAASQNLIPEEDMIPEALGTAGLAFAASGRGILDSYDPNTVRVFAGKRSPNLSRDESQRLLRAENILKEDKYADPYNETKFFQGADGKLRFEIDDKPSVFKNDFIENSVTEGKQNVFPLRYILKHPELYRVYPSLLDMPVDIKDASSLTYRAAYNPKDKRIVLGKTSNPDDMKKSLLHEIQHAIQDYEGFSGGSSPQYGYSKTQASDFNQNVRSTKEVRDLSDANYNFQKIGADLSPLYKVQYINKLNNIIEKAIEGRAKPREVFRLGDWYKYGDQIRRNIGRPMPKKAGPDRDNWIASAVAQIRDFELKEINENMVTRFQYEDTKKQFPSKREVDNAVKRLERKQSKFRDKSFKYRTIDNRLRDIIKLDDMKAYLQEAGEVEARNVSKRLDLDTAPDINPFSTEDVPRWKQIISNFTPRDSLSNIGLLSLGSNRGIIP